MGLDTTHDAWHGAYSAFTRWRNKLAEVAGYWVEPGHIANYSKPEIPDTFIAPTVAIDWGHVTEANLDGKWATIPHNIHGEPDPLLILLAHRDESGWIFAEHCGPLADRLEQLLPQLDEIDPDQGHIGDWRQKTERFINGLRTAAANGEDVEFS